MDVKTLCLGVLCHGDATGYDIKKHFETAFSHFFHTKPSWSILNFISKPEILHLFTFTEVPVK